MRLEKILNITNLATTAALTAAENKIPKISEIENKITTDHDHDKYITTQKFNKLTTKTFTTRLAQANLANKSDIANFVKKTDFNDNNKLKNVILNKNKLNELSKKVKAISTEELTQY